MRNTLRKTSVDIPAFIAEGCGKPTSSESARAIVAAIALANRLEYFSLMARDLRILSDEGYDIEVGAIVEVRKMLSGFAKKLET